jgi:protein farnesyltransferase subunit beta
VLSGLSSAQHKWDLKTQQIDSMGGMGGHWDVSPFRETIQIFDEKDRVGSIHPVYAISGQQVDQIKAYFAAKQGF